MSTKKLFQILNLPRRFRPDSTEDLLGSNKADLTKATTEL